jgi:type I restriction enzyme R subunit
VLKKLSGVACVQTLSRLNRTYPGKAETGTYVLDFVNDPEDIVESFQPYYKTAAHTDVSDPNQIHDLFNKLGAGDIYTWPEVESFASVFFSPKKLKKTLSSLCKPAKDRWQGRYLAAVGDIKDATRLFARTKKTGDAVLMANAETDLKDAKKRKDDLDIFKKDLGSFTRFYEFISQVVPLADPDLEKLNVYARHLVGCN